MMIPGRLLHRVAACLCCAKTLERVVEPAIADFQKEYEAARGALRRAWVLLRGYLAILKVIAVCALSVSTTTPDERQAIVRTMAWSLTLIVAVTGLLMLPPLSIVEARLSPWVLVRLIPQAVPLAIPIGLTFGIAFGLAGRASTRAVIRVVFVTVLAASLVSFVTLAWVMPDANQAFRESVARALGHSGQLMKGASEMTFSELDREMAIASAARNPRQAAGYAWTFHLRFALSAASAVLAAFLFSTAGTGAALRGLLAFAACVAYWALLHTGETLAVYSAVAPSVAGTVPPFIGAWLPNIVLGSFAILVASSRFLTRG